MSPPQPTSPPISHSPRALPPPNGTGSYQCIACPKTFKRAEHLKRHQDAHASGKTFTCPTCGKGFARSDVLARHKFIHSQSRLAESRSAFGIQVPRQPRACASCAQARERCTRDTPCQRCSARALNCVYPPSDGTYRMKRMKHGSSATSRRSAGDVGGNSPATLHTMAYPDEASSRMQPPIDLGMNWLPMSDAMDLEFSSILNLGLSSGIEAAVPSPNDQPFVFPAFLGTTESSPNEAAQSQSHPSPGRSPATTSSGISSSSRISNMTRPGRLYATSSSARAPAFLPDMPQVHPVLEANPQLPISRVASSLDLTERHLASALNPLDTGGLEVQGDVEFESHGLVWPATYDKLASEYQALCISCEGQNCVTFENSNFPTSAQLSMFVHLFYRRFIPALPILHQTFCSVNHYWPLTLAMATIGCQYTRTIEFESMVRPLHEFLRRALQREIDSQRDPEDQIHYVAALLLSQIGHFYYGNAEMKSKALSRRGVLIQMAENIGLFAPEPRSELWQRGDASVGDKWKQWIHAETRRRLVYTIWMLDVMALYHFGVRPLLPHQVPQADLPHDALWTAPNEHDWGRLMDRTERNPPLALAVRKIFLEKEVKPDLGEFGRTLLLHGVYHEIHQVRVYFQRPLSAWVPAAQQVSAATDMGNSPQTASDASGQHWLQGSESFSAWRNAALDCVDALHWWANGVIALQVGRENPTVLHLHYSRIVLLVPVKEILCLILSVTNYPSKDYQSPARSKLYEAEQEVLRWAHRDESKARLAAIHCGCVFWHLRRFSTMAFYEPQSVFHATLALWAYSYYVSQHAPPRLEPGQTAGGHMTSNYSDLSPHTSPETEGSAACSRVSSDFNEMEDPAFIWLDRPNDDEMVQCFVRSGRPVNMKAYMSGIGDIYEPKSRAKILREGLKVLESVAFAWGRDLDYVNILRAAERVMLEAEMRRDGYDDGHDSRQT